MMSSAHKTDEELLVLAKKQLTLPHTDNDKSLPNEYLAELKKHISIFPDDTNFIINRQPSSGFGVLTCLETGCNLQVPLTRSTMASDGGKKGGVGSLMAYREHINTHPTHKSSRRQRLSSSSSPAVRSSDARPSSNFTGSGSASSTSNSRLRLVNVIGKDSSPALSRDTSSASVNGRTSFQSSLALDATTTLNSSVPMKRPLESHPESNIGDKGTSRHTAKRKVYPPEPLASEKAHGRGELVRIPLATHDDNRSPTSSSAAFSVARVSLPDTPEALTSIHPAVSNAELSLHSAARGMRKAAESFVDDMPVLRQVPALDIPLPSVSLEPVLRLPPMPAPLQTQMFNDGMYRAMERLMGMPVVGDVCVGGDPWHSDEDDDENVYGLGMGNRDSAGHLQKFFQDAGNAEQFDTNASVGDALRRLGLPSLSARFPGLDIVLMPHQVIGVAWMLDREKSKNKGGILSDEMGLGKTVQMIATIMANRSSDPAAKTTLIVAPLALLGQWKLEIELKTNNGLSVHVYHGTEKAKAKKLLQKADVVLTTYGTLAQEWFDEEAYLKEVEMAANGKKRKSKKKNGFITSDSEDEKIEKKKRRKSGLLFTVSWHRIVLDEAQNIRNRRTRNSKAVTYLEATYRWCLTGTPIVNGLEDAYGLLRFLEIAPWNEREEFYKHIVLSSKRQPSLCSARLQAIFATCLLRRRKDSKLDGKKLIELPPKDVQLVKLEFTPEEQEIYKAVESQSQMKFNRYLRAGTVLKNYAHVLVLLLRLRQICTHTSLITEDDGIIIDDELENMDEDKRDDVIKAHTELGRDYVDRLKTKLRDVALERMAAEKKSTDATIAGEECPLCYDNFTDPVVTRCMHVYCRGCIHEVLARPASDDANMKADERPCPVCRGAVCKRMLFSRMAFEPTDEELTAVLKGAEAEAKDAKSPVNDEHEEMPDVASLVRPTKGIEKTKSTDETKKPRKRRAKRVVLDSDEEGEEEDDEDDLSDFIVYTDEDEDEKDERRRLKKRLGKQRAYPGRNEEGNDTDDDDEIVFGRKKPIVNACFAPIKTMSKLLPSTKMKHMMSNLENWARGHPDEKTMVISQWTQALDLVSDYLSRRGITHVKFQGNMSREKRDKAIRIFMKKGDATVMLMSLKCGGVGLNLTRANRVISLDLGWSEAVENQAFDRVHRLGQTRPVFVERLVICNTVEDRVLALQEKKRNLADGSLGEGNGKRIGRLSVRELANLFGLDQHGNRLGD